MVIQFKVKCTGTRGLPQKDLHLREILILLYSWISVPLIGNTIFIEAALSSAHIWIGDPRYPGSTERIRIVPFVKFAGTTWKE